MGEFPLRDGPERPFMIWIMTSLVLPGGVWAWAEGNEGMSVWERNRNQGEMKLFDAVGMRLSATTSLIWVGLG
jgi:hypothetical protein